MENNLKEVSLKEYKMWYEKLVINEPNECSLEEFSLEIQNWKLYDVTYNYVDDYNNIKFIRELDIPTPYLQSYLLNKFKQSYDFTKNGISNLKVTSFDREYKQNNRSYIIQLFNLNQWGELMFS